MTQVLVPRRRTILTHCASMLLLAVASCSGLPNSGPRTQAILDGSKVGGAPGSETPYVLIDLNEFTARDASSAPSQLQAASLPAEKTIGLIGPGDQLRVTIWEANPSGQTLIDKPGLDLPVIVDPYGYVSVPYVGRVRAAERTPVQVEAAIRQVLAAQGHEMQASLLVTGDVTNAVMVQGDVARPGRYNIAGEMRGLLDVLALAGGVKATNQSTEIRVSRGGSNVTVSLSRIVADPAKDLHLSPGDRVMVIPRPHYFYAFGAVNRSGEQVFDADEMTLARTLARLTGLNDEKANPSGVFIYRHQSSDLTRRVAGRFLRSDQDPTKVVYRIDLRDPHGFFVTENFRILPEDIVYVSEAPLAELAKLTQIIAGFSSVASGPRSLAGPY